MNVFQKAVNPLIHISLLFLLFSFLGCTRDDMLPVFLKAKHPQYKNQVIFVGPFSGVARIKGTGNYVNRGAIALLKKQFTDQEINDLKRIAVLPNNQIPTKQEIDLVKRLSYFLLYELRREIQNYYYDGVPKLQDDNPNNIRSGYKTGPCSLSSYFVRQVLEALGFDVASLDMYPGHTSFAVRIGSAVQLLDTTFSIILFANDEQELLKKIKSIDKYYIINTGQNTLDRLTIENLHDWYSHPPEKLSFGRTIYQPSQEGLPVQIEKNQILTLDYSGNGGEYFLARLITIYSQAPEQIIGDFSGRIHSIKLQGYAVNPIPGVISIPGKLIPASTHSIMGINKDISISNKKTVTCKLFEIYNNKSLKGEYSQGISIFLRNISLEKMWKIKDPEKRTEVYNKLKSGVLNIKVMDNNGNFFLSKDIPFSTRSIIFFVKPDSPVPHKIALRVLTKDLSIELSSDFIEQELDLSPSEEKGFNEMFLDGKSLHFFEGSSSISQSLPYTPWSISIDLSKIPKNIAWLRSDVAYRLSPMAFPFHLSQVYDSIELEFPGEGNKPVWLNESQPLLPFHVEATLSESHENNPKEDSSFSLIALRIMDHARQERSDVCVNFPSLWKSVFPLVPIYSKDKNRPDMTCGVSPNENGAITFLYNNRDDLPKQVRISHPQTNISEEVNVDYDIMNKVQ